MVELIIAAILSIIGGIIGFLWINGIDNMKQNHSDYKGDDFLDWENNHTEREF